MMKYTIIYFLLLNFTSLPAQQPYFSTTKDYNNGWEMLYSIVTVPDGYVLCGGTTDSLTYEQGVFILKTDKWGNMIWRKTFADTSLRYAAGYHGSLVARKNGGYFLCNSVKLLPGGNVDLTLFRFNLNGDTLYTRRLGGAYFDTGSVCREAEDGSVYVCGRTSSMGDTLGDMLLAKYDSSGVLLWAKNYGQTGRTEDARTMELDSLGNVYISGFAEVGYTPGFYVQSHPVLVKTDSSGNILWSKIINNTSGQFNLGSIGFVHILNTDRIFLHYTDSDEDAVSIPHIILYDSAGNVIFNKEIVGLRYGCGLIRAINTNNNLIVACGQANVDLAYNQPFPNYKDNGGLAVKYSPAGDSIWARYYIVKPGQDQSFFQDIDTSHFGGYIMAGGYWDSAQDIWVVSTDSSGCLGPEDCGIEQVTFRDVEYDAHTIRVYPNPTSSRFRISLPEMLSNSDVINSGSNLFKYAPAGTMYNPMQAQQCEAGYSDYRAHSGLFRTSVSSGKTESVLLPLYQLKIFDISGACIFNDTFSDLTQEEIDLGKYAPGLYLIRLEYGKNIFTGKVVLSAE